MILVFVGKTFELHGFLLTFAGVQEVFRPISGNYPSVGLFCFKSSLESRRFSAQGAHRSCWTGGSFASSEQFSLLTRPLSLLHESQKAAQLGRFLWAKTSLSLRVAAAQSS